MRPAIRLAATIVVSALLITSLSYLTALSSEEDEYAERDDLRDSLSSFKSLFAFQSPSSLFTPGATISLTDDNSTYFAARPAAFGPFLPSHGLDGELWVGAGFRQDHLRGMVSAAEHAGELGCSDVSDDWQLRTTSDSEKDLKGKIAMLMRGICSFNEKVLWAQRRGAKAVIVGDNIPGGPLVRMYARGDTSNISIPSLFTSHTTAHLLLTLKEGALVYEDQSSTTAPSDNSRFRWSQVQYEGEEFEFKLPSNMNKGKHGHEDHHGLWVTLTPTNMSTSPFLNTLFVLVISPLVTLAVVYAMLLLRSRIRRRRWRAPKSLVERLPVRIYRKISRTSSNNSDDGHQEEPRQDSTQRARSSSTTPLLVETPQELPADDAPSSSQYGSFEQNRTEVEKAETGLAAWRRKYGGKQVECVICLEEYEDGISKVMQLPCGHEFHAECITPWLTTRRRTCPICKGDIVRSMTQDSDSEQHSAGPMSEEEVQDQAAQTVNSSPAAALPIPNATHEALDDLEGASHQRLPIDPSLWSSSLMGSIQRRLDAFRARAGISEHSSPETHR